MLFEVEEKFWGELVSNEGEEMAFRVNFEGCGMISDYIYQDVPFLEVADFFLGSWVDKNLLDDEGEISSWINLCAYFLETSQGC